ncbi:tropomyosin-like [Chenopodium quinoa]|uniref:tropomyosin-like n=1 Tax=Chenopodium quinoa TaxID=63459 RepID=UPI000B7864AB|nr:tropomyosin-like [Chenopodium quinoa]
MRQPLGGAEEVQAGGDQTEGGETTEPEKADEVPSTSFSSFKSFQSVDMGFSAKKCSIPAGVRAEIWGKHKRSAEAYFGGCSDLSEMEQVREWSVRATAGIAEPGPSVPNPARDNQKLLMQVVYNHTMTCEMIDTLQEKVDISETEAKLAQLKQEKAEHRAQVVIDSFDTFYAEMERDILPQIDEGEALLNAFGAVDVPSLKAKIQQKIDIEVKSQVLARDEISREKIKILEGNVKQHLEACKVREKELIEARIQLESQRQSITGLEVQLKSQEERFSQAQARAEQTEQRLADAEAQLERQRESSQKAMEEVQKKLADAEQASQAEIDLLARLQAEDAEMREAELKEAEVKGAEVQASVRPASSAAGADAALDSTPIGMPDPPAEA